MNINSDSHTLSKSLNPGHCLYTWDLSPLLLPLCYAPHPLGSPTPGMKAYHKSARAPAEPSLYTGNLLTFQFDRQVIKKYFRISKYSCCLKQCYKHMAVGSSGLLSLSYLFYSYYIYLALCSK